MNFIIHYRSLVPKNVIPGTLKLKSRMGNIIHLNLPEKNVPPYMHVMAYLNFFGYTKEIVQFTQQGLEKLNDISTKNFQRSSNHRDHETLKKILQKMNRVELLRDQGYERDIRQQKCSICKVSPTRSGPAECLHNPNLTMRTMQLNVWMANHFMNIEILFYLLHYNIITLKCLKNYTPFCLSLSFCTTEYLVSITMNGMRGRPIILHLLIRLFYLL